MHEYKFQWDGDSWSVTTQVPFLESKVEISVISEDCDEEPPTQKQIAVLDKLQSFGKETIDVINDAAEEYRKKIDYAVGLSEYGLGHINRSNISQHYRNETITIPRLGDSTQIYFFICAECDWEPEHGMEILFHGTEILKCGGQNGLYLNEEWDDYIREGG